MRMLHAGQVPSVRGHSVGRYTGVCTVIPPGQCQLGQTGSGVWFQATRSWIAG